MNTDRYPVINHPLLQNKQWPLQKRVEHIQLYLQDLEDVFNKYFHGKYVFNISQKMEQKKIPNSKRVIDIPAFSAILYTDKFQGSLTYKLEVFTYSDHLYDDKNGDFKPVFYIRRFLDGKALIGGDTGPIREHALVKAVETLIKDDYISAIGKYGNDVSRLSMSIRKIATDLESI